MNVPAAMIAATGLTLCSGNVPTNASCANRNQDWMSNLPTFKVDDAYIVTLHAKAEQQRFVVERGIQTPVWTLLWLDAKNLTSKRTRRVWSIYLPWDYARLPKSSCPRDFTFGMRNEHVVGLAFLLGKNGPTIRFYEIDLARTVEPAKVPDQPFRPGAAYRFPSSFLRSVGHEHVLSFIGLLRDEYGDRLELLTKGAKPRIKEVAWVDERWRVTVAFGEKEFSFIRNASETEWNLEKRG